MYHQSPAKMTQVMPVVMTALSSSLGATGAPGSVPGVISAYSHPAAASGWGMVVVSISQKYAGHSAQVLALAAQLERACPWANRRPPVW